MGKHVTESSLAIVSLDGYSSLAAAISAIGSNNKTITISKPTTVSTVTTVPANVALQVQNGGILDVSSTLTINGPLQAGTYRIFDGYGTITISPITTASIHSSWFGFSPSTANPAWNTTYLTRALSALDSYGIFIVDPGNYDISGAAINTAVKTDITILGYGASIEQKKVLSRIFHLSNKDRLRIEGFRLVGLGTDYTGANQTLACDCIIVYLSDSIVFKNLDFLNFGFSGIHIATGCSNVLITDCRMEGTGRRLGNIETLDNGQFGIYVNGQTQSGFLRIARCEMSWTCFGTFIAGKWDSVDFTENNIHDIIGQHGLYYDFPRNTTITGNIIRNVAPGCAGMKLQLTDSRIQWMDNIAITGNTLDGCGYSIILITAAAIINYSFKNVIISGNSIMNSDSDAIYIREGLGINIVGNTISNCGNYGIRAEGNLIAISNNLISHTGSAGIYTRTGSYYEEWNGGGTYVQGHIVLASDNILYECQEDGGEVQDPTTDIPDGYWTQLNNVNMVTISNNTILDPYYLTDVSSMAIFMTAKKYGSVAFVHDNIIRDGYNQLDWPIYSYAQIDVYIYNNYISPGCGILRPLGPVRMAYNNTAKWYSTPTTGFGRGTGRGRTFFSNAAPITDGYTRGDIMWNMAPATGTNTGWLCTTTGTPGTWKPFGLTSIPEIAPSDGYAMTWNSSSSLWEYKTKITRRVETIGSPASPGGLREITGFSGVDTIEVSGFWAVGDGGGGTFAWDSASTTNDDYGTIIRPLSIAPASPGRWKRVFDNSEVDVKWFGAVGDGIVDDYGSINWAIASRSSYGGTVRFSCPPLVYRVTGSIVVGTKYVPEVDAIEGIYTAGSGDLYLAARAMKHVNLKGDEGAAIWGDFTADGYQAIIYYSIPYGYPYKVNSEVSVIEGLVIHGKPSFTPGSPPVIVATQDPAAADAYQVGICVPWVCANTIKNCVARYCAVGHLYSQNYWSRNEHNSAICCHEGFCIRQANASSTNDCKALFCDRGFVFSGQTFSAYGLHTELCGTDLWLKKFCREFAIRSCYFENTACHRDSYSIMMGDPDDGEAAQVSAGTFENMHFGRTVIGGEGGGSGYLILTYQSSGCHFRMAQMGLVAPTTWNALHLNYCAMFYHDASPTVNESGYNGNAIIHLRTTSQAWNLTQGRMFVNNDFEFLDETRGVILKSPGGTRYRITVEDDGYLVTTAL